MLGCVGLKIPHCKNWRWGCKYEWGLIKTITFVYCSFYHVGLTWLYIPRHLNDHMWLPKGLKGDGVMVDVS